MQAQVWEAIKKERDHRTELPLFINGRGFQMDLESKFKINTLDNLKQDIDPNLQWKTLDNTFIAMTWELARSIIVAGALREQAIFKTAEIHRLTMLASSTPETYDYTTNWP
jgi:hypothetical protein